MDPLSHAALGRTLGALARGDRALPGALSATVAGALAPDIDAVMMPFGWDRYLAIHEIGTHTIFGTAACALLVAVVVRRLVADTSWRTLVLAGWAGAVSHVLLDLLSSARIRALWPIVDRQFSIPLVAMADPWLAALLVAGLPALWMTRWPQRRVALTLLALTGLFLAIKAGLAIAAVRAYSADVGKPAPTVFQVQATWAAIREWDIFDRTPSQLRAWHVTAGAGSRELRLTWPLRAESANVIRSRRTSVVRNFLRAHDLVFAVTVPRDDDGELVFWSDIRFCWNAAIAGSPQLGPIVEADGHRIGCGLWFGAEIDGEGRIVRQIVRIGSFTQTRAPDG